MAAVETYRRGNTWWARHNGARHSLKVRVGCEGEQAKIEAALAALLTVGPTARSEQSKHAGGITLKQVYEKALKVHYADAKDISGVQSRWRDLCAFSESTTKDRIRVSDPIACVSGKQFTEYKAWLLKKGNTTKTVNRKVSLVTKLCNLAAEWEEIDRVPKVKRYREEDGRIRWLSHAEEDTVLAFFVAGAGGGGRVGNHGEPEQARTGAEHMADLVPVLLDTGMRLGEALRVEDKDLHFNFTKDERLPPSRVTVWFQKGRKPRTIPLTDRVALILYTRMRREPARDEKQKGTSRPFGSCLTQDSAGKLWALCRDAMGLALDCDFVIHALRHTFAVRLVEAREDIRVIQDLLGHSKVTTTEKYAHVSGRAAKGAIDKLERVRGDVPGAVAQLRVVAAK